MTKVKIPMTQEAAARIEKANSQETGGKTPKNSFASRAKKAAEKNQKGEK